jgi:dephospho-CoA kinase
MDSPRRKQSKPIIGLCGGIGSGKSQVARILADQGGLVIDSDALNREVLQEPEVIQTLREWWGEAVFGADGQVDRKAVAGIVFKDPQARRRLESLVHPLIAARRDAMIRQGSGDPAVKAIILDSPLLIESTLDRLCDAIIYVEASETTRLRRLKQQRGWDAADLRRREQWQAPLAEKRARSGYRIRNEGTLAELREQTVRALEQIIAEHACAR